MAKRLFKPNTTISESDRAFLAGFAVKDADDPNTREISPILANGENAGREEHEVINCDESRERKKRKNEKDDVNPNCRLFVRYVGPRLLDCEIKELHPDIVSVKAYRVKGQCVLTFCNEMKAKEAFEELEKKQVNGKKIRVFKYKPIISVPFVNARHFHKNMEPEEASRKT